jgi:phosphatidylglycerol:prolipoprotein diacylglycerol transferase
MHPVLFRFGPVIISSYGAALVVSLLAGIVVARIRARQLQVDPHAVVEAAIAMMIAALAGSRLWYVVTHLDKFDGNWIRAILPVENGQITMAGLAMNGGVLLALAAVWGYSRVKKIAFAVLGDIIAPSFLLGAGIQRLFGCFMNGCCFGRPTAGALGMVFPADCPAGALYPGIPLWPTQLLASLLGFTGFILVVYLYRWYCFPGYSLWMVFMYYPLARFFVDQFRYVPQNQVLANAGPVTFTVDHILLLPLLTVSITGWMIGWIKYKRHMHKHHET